MHPFSLPRNGTLVKLLQALDLPILVHVSPLFQSRGGTPTLHFALARAHGQIASRAQPTQSRSFPWVVVVLRDTSLLLLLYCYVSSPIGSAHLLATYRIGRDRLLDCVRALNLGCVSGREVLSRDCSRFCRCPVQCVLTTVQVGVPSPNLFTLRSTLCMSYCLPHRVPSACLIGRYRVPRGICLV